MRILQLNAYADPLGGAEVYALTLSRELRKRGHVVGLMGTSPHRETDEEFERVVHRPLYDARALWHEPRVSSALRAFAERLRPDLVHVHNVFSLGFDVLTTLGSLGVPTIQTVHDFNRVCPNSWCVRGDGTVCDGGIGAQCFANDCQKNYPFDAQVALHAFLRHRALLDLVDVSICPSRALADSLERHGSRNVVHIPNAIEPIPAPGAERKPKELLYVGRLTPEKGVDYLLAALPMIRAKEPDVHLTLVAGGSPPASITSEIERRDGVTLLTNVPRPELGRFYATATACVIPSIWCENAPLVALECLAAGLPMLASRIGGIPELVEDGVTGFTFRPRDAVNLAETTLRYLAMERHQRDLMSATLRERSTRYRLDAHVSSIELLYAKVGVLQRVPVTPTADLDDDFLALLRQQGREISDAVYGRAGELRPFPTQRPTRALARGLRRVARTLRLPKLFPS